jgi:hypothetical protein
MKNAHILKSRHFSYFRVSIKGNYFLLVSKSGVRERTAPAQKAHPSQLNPSNFPTLHFAERTKHVRGQKVAILLKKKRQYWLCSPEIPGTESIFAGEREGARLNL